MCVFVLFHTFCCISLPLSLQAHTGLIQMVAPPMTHFKRSARVRALVRVRACVCSCVCVRATAVLIWHPGFACCSVGRRVDSGSSKHKHPTGGPRRVWSRLVTLVSGQRTAPNSCLCQERAVNQPISQPHTYACSCFTLSLHRFTDAHYGGQEFKYEIDDSQLHALIQLSTLAKQSLNFFCEVSTRSSSP